MVDQQDHKPKNPTEPKKHTLNSLKSKQKVKREKPMVVTDDDLRDISSYKKYKVKAKPVRGRARKFFCSS